MTVHPIDERIFAALGDKNRFEIVNLLSQRGEMRAGDIVEISEGSAPSISRHLRILRTSGILNMRAVSQTRLYSINEDMLVHISKWIDQKATNLVA